MKLVNNPFANNSVVTLKNQEWLEKQRIAGKITAGALTLLEGEVKAGTTKTLLELDKLAETYIRDNGCTPTFLGYKGYPASVCCSVGRQLVHGIPNSYVLQDGDKISFDLGASYKESISDSALTILVGNPRSNDHVKLVDATEDALMRGIEEIAVGRRLGVIGSAISRCAKRYGLSVVVNYGGHGIGLDRNGVGVPHEPPFICNVGDPNEGVRIVEGMVLALEPLFVIGKSSRTRVLDDKWTVVCDDICSHHEHSIFVHRDGIEIVSYRNNENCLKSNMVYFKKNNEKIEQ